MLFIFYFHIKKRINLKGYEFLVVNSAVGGITNLLPKIASKAYKNAKIYTVQLNELKTKHLKIVHELLPNYKFSDSYLANLFQNLENILHGVFLLKELTKRSLELILSFGERLASYILSSYLNEKNVYTEFLDTRKLFVTDSTFGYAIFLETAHPVKFLDVVEPLIESKIEIPKRLEKIITKEKNQFIWRIITTN